MPRFEEEIHQVTESHKIPGVSLLVARGEEILYQNQFGLASLLPLKTPLQSHHLFDIASLTKPVVTTTLLLLKRKTDRLSLDTPLVKQLPELSEGEKERITLRHLLKHTSGLPAWKAFYEEIRLSHPDLWGKRDCGQIYLDKISHESLEVPIAYRRIYSDLGFILLGLYLERLQGKPLDQLFSECVASPLGLSQTRFISNEAPPIDRTLFVSTENSPVRQKILQGEVHDENAYCLGGVAGHAGLFSNSLDLHRFLYEIEKGYHGQSEFFPQEDLHEFIGPKVKIKLGWDTPEGENSQAGIHFSRNSIGHLGYTGCSFWIDLDRKFHIILLTNRVHPSSQDETIKTFRPRLHNLIYEELILPCLPKEST